MADDPAPLRVPCLDVTEVRVFELEGLRPNPERFRARFTCDLGPIRIVGAVLAVRDGRHRVIVPTAGGARILLLNSDVRRALQTAAVRAYELWLDEAGEPDGAP